MSDKVYKVFEEVEQKAQLLAKYWHNFSTEISEHLPDTYQPELQELTSKLELAIANLVEELRNPTLTLATTGTTSSGKSTLVNLLCGAEIVPVAVSEMSAGVVTIEYSERPSLTIHETPGALWECGEWRGITDEGIYQRLYKVMINYIDNRETQPNLVCPQSTISYPFRLLKESKLELPRGVKVKIMDLPGLAYVGDEGNASVIKQCREALCLVTYNSAETDKEKMRSLLQEVVEQVKDLGGSPARMLFVLNRIDVFRADRNYPETENRFVEKTINSIKQELIERLKEYTEDIEKLQVIKLSTWAALLALQIKSNDEICSLEACKKADEHFNGLIDEDILEDLPRKAEKWDRHGRNRVADSLWRKSYGEEFQEHLRKHISQHFPRLVIPQAIERFNVAAGNAVTEWAIQTTSAILNSSKDHYEQECERISSIRVTLDSFLRISDENLREPFEEIEKVIENSKDENEIFNVLKKTISDFTKDDNKPYKELDNKLYPLYGWKTELGQGINSVLDSVANSLDNGRVTLDSLNLKRANVIYVKLLGNCLQRLIDLGYTASVAKSGKTIEARTHEEKRNLRQLNEELNELAMHLNLVMEDVLKQIINQEVERIYQSVVDLFNFHLSHIEIGANERAHNIVIKFPQSKLVKIDTKPNINVHFKAGFPITTGTWQEETQAPRKKRIWWTLWLAKKTVYDTKYETRSSENGKIPSTEDLLSSWVLQARQAESEIVKSIINWLIEQINCLKKNIGRIQNDVLDRYQERLDTANKEINMEYELQKNVWQPMQQKAQKLVEDFQNL